MDPTLIIDSMLENEWSFGLTHQRRVPESDIGIGVAGAVLHNSTSSEDCEHSYF